MFALSFALLFLLKDYGADRYLNNDDIIYYIQQFKIIHDLSWSEIFYRFISRPSGNEPLFWAYYKVAWTLLFGNTILFTFSYYFITFGLIVYLAKIVDANKFVIISLCVLLVNFSVFITLMQVWRHTVAFLILLIGILLFFIRERKWLPRIIIYSTILFHLSTALIIVIFEAFILLTKRKSYKFETIKLYNKEIIAFASFAILTFFFASRYGLSIVSNINLDNFMIYYQRIHNEAKLIDFLNWFTLLICMYLWLNRKKLTNTDVFIATQYFIYSILLIYLPMPNIFGRYTYYVLMGGSIIIGRLIITANFRLGIILLIFLFCYDIYQFNYNTKLISNLSYRLYDGHLNPAYGLSAMILNYDTILLNFDF